MRKSVVLIRWATTALFACGFLFFGYIVYVKTQYRPQMLAYRLGLIGAVYSFALLNVWISPKKLYDFIFKYRIAISIAVFSVLILLKINFSSIGMFNSYVQPNSGNYFSSPIFGTARSIRSDEWAISTPRALTFQYCKTSKTNNIIMGAETPNLIASGIQLSLSMLSRPLKIGYFVSSDFGLSFYWCGTLLLSIIAGIEFFMIISNGKKLLSCLGASTVVFSGFFMWWSFVPIVTFGMSAIVCAYYLITENTVYKRILFGFLLSVSGSSFVSDLYPAWQVVFGYCFLAIMLWIIISNKSCFANFKWYDFLIVVFTVLFTLSVIVKSLLDQRDYLTAIMNTVYPGSREETGGYSLYKLFLSPLNLLFPFISEGISTSENGTFLSFFPLPLILGVFALIKTKGKDLLLILLTVVSIPLLFYCTTGLPYMLAKLLLLTFSTDWRAVDAFAFLQVIILIRSMAVLYVNDASLPLFVAVPLSAFIGIFTVCVAKKYYPSYAPNVFLIVFAVFAFAAALAFSYIKAKRFTDILTVIVSLTILFVGIMVSPVQKGADVIYEKPVAKKISSIVDNDSNAKWAALDQWVEADFYAACGAKVINSNNFMPNIKMWETIFPNGEKEDAYNRYANLIVHISDSTCDVKVLTPDLLNLSITYSKLDELGVKYLIAKSPINDNPSGFSLNKLYEEDGIYIYKLAK